LEDADLSEANLQGTDLQATNRPHPTHLEQRNLDWQMRNFFVRSGQLQLTMQSDLLVPVSNLHLEAYSSCGESNHIAAQVHH
jgi:hypothetical protein